MARIGLHRTWRIICLILVLGITVTLAGAVALSPDLSESITDYVASFLPDKNIRILRSIAYTFPADTKRTGDLYLSSTFQKPHPAIVLVHGGSWTKGDKAELSEVVTARYLAGKGFVVFVIDYRLTGAGGEFPCDVEDTRSALSFILSNRQRWNIDPQRLYVGGSSSGATTAMLAGYLPDEVFSHQSVFRRKNIRAVLSFSGPTDLLKEASNPYLKSYLQPYSKVAMNGKIEAALVEASPITHAKTALPTVFIHGTDDKNVPISHAESMISTLQANQIPVTIIKIEGAGHFLGTRSRKLALEQALQFLSLLPSSSNKDAK